MNMLQNHLLVVNAREPAPSMSVFASIVLFVGLMAFAGAVGLFIAGVL